MKVILLKMQSCGFSPCKQRVTFLPSHRPRLWKPASHAWSINLGTCQTGQPKPGQGTQKWGSDGHLSVRSKEVHVTQTPAAHTPIYIKWVASDIEQIMPIRFPPLLLTFFMPFDSLLMWDAVLKCAEPEHDSTCIRQIKMKLRCQTATRVSYRWDQVSGKTLADIFWESFTWVRVVRLYNMIRSTSWCLHTLVQYWNDDASKNTWKPFQMKIYIQICTLKCEANRTLKLETHFFLFFFSFDDKCYHVYHILHKQMALPKTNDIQRKYELLPINFAFM